MAPIRRETPGVVVRLPQKPRVSVICAVRDGQKWLPGTIASLRAQRLRDFEVVFVDDASTDASARILAAVDDPRFVVATNPVNRRLVATRNRAIGLARAEYLAICDQDDPSHPARLLRQAAFLDANPRASGVYSWIRSIDARGRRRPGVAAWAYAGAQARAALLFHNFVTHSTLMFRRSCAPDPVYAPDYPLCEDYRLIAHLADTRDGLFALREALVDYRYHDANHTLSAGDEMARHARRLRGHLLARLGVVASDAQMAVHDCFESLRTEPTLPLMRACRDWLDHLSQANRRSGFVQPAAFDAVAAAVWLELSHKFARLGRAAWREYECGPRAGLARAHLPSVARLWARCMVRTGWPTGPGAR